MKIKSLIGVIVGGTSIAFSTICFVITPVFTPAIVLAALAGAFSGAVAMALQTRRTAIVTFTFSLTPLCGFIVLENVAEYVGTGYAMFIPLAMAFVVAAWALIDYSKAKRAAARAGVCG